MIQRIKGVVRPSEIDNQSVVNHLKYLEWFEFARYEYLKSLGIDAVLLAQQGINLMVYEISNIKYKGSAKIDDIYTVESKLTRISNVKIKFDQQVKIKDKVIVTVEVFGCAVNANTGKLDKKFIMENLQSL